MKSGPHHVLHGKMALQTARHLDAGPIHAQGAQLWVAALPVAELTELTRRTGRRGAARFLVFVLEPGSVTGMFMFTAFLLVFLCIIAPSEPPPPPPPAAAAAPPAPPAPPPSTSSSSSSYFSSSSFSSSSASASSPFPSSWLKQGSQNPRVMVRKMEPRGQLRVGE